MQPSDGMILRPRFFEAFDSRPHPTATRIVRPVVSPHEGARLRELLAAKTAAALSVEEIRIEVEGNLWVLTPEAFRYFLPAFLRASLEFYAAVSVFASELVGALTEPARGDVVEALDRAAPHQGLNETTALLREQQLEWFDSGTPLAIFHERVDGLTPAEGAAVLAFFVALDEARGADFPFGELELAVVRHWSRYRGT